MAFGFYFHTPYCIQRCTYCDFATYEKGTVPEPEVYFPALLNELHAKRQLIAPQQLTSIYFGGGTPSLVDPLHLIQILTRLKDYGFTINSSTEVTIEINPATVSEAKLNLYLENGINRFSVGAQTFNDTLLKSVHREHSAEDTRKTLRLLEKYNLNYSFDILFALPKQSLQDLQNDLIELQNFQPKHISPYCLTVPESHPLAKNRAPEGEQIEMFENIHNTLEKYGFYQYEISNYAQPGFESQHNLLYWQDQPYLGIGLSAHSYLKNNWGSRFWNKSNIKEYLTDHAKATESFSLQSISQNQIEHLSKAQSLTDFCHTSLRLNTGLDLSALENKFGTDVRRFIKTKLQNPRLASLVEIKKQIESPTEKANVNQNIESYCLTRQGQFISNSIFEFFTFFDKDLEGL